MRGAVKDLREMYGPGISSKLNDQLRSMNDPSSIDDPDDRAETINAPGSLVMRLRRKRQAALMKDILKSGGYGDIARSVSFHKEG